MKKILLVIVIVMGLGVFGVVLVDIGNMVFGVGDKI